MFIAAALYCAPNIVISCYSPGQRWATTLLQQTADFCLLLPDGKSRILKQNQEELVLRSVDGKATCTFKSFPRSVSGLRGQGGDEGIIIILDEASKIKPALIPLMGVNNTAVIAISTPPEASNHLSELLVDMKLTG
jgi:hypothetical protein